MLASLVKVLYSCFRDCSAGGSRPCPTLLTTNLLRFQRVLKYSRDTQKRALQ
ncbi:hypothetical protein E2C01_070966 [Portunus trituberculatus]|uniref:Uncharacterized protein n=1 Tax=Portunus trituberculatus TaxID=210409 RepID=A0A5B7HVM7_PORTR|nr:hypothetical protein [Portunus trituberculatus]